MSFGVRWALTMRFSNGTSRAARVAAACAIVSQSEALPMMIPTSGDEAISFKRQAVSLECPSPAKESGMSGIKPDLHQTDPPSKGPNEPLSCLKLTAYRLSLSQQRRALRHPDDGRAGDLVVPRLPVVVEGDPDKAQAGDKRQEAAQSTHGCYAPIERAVVEAHDLQAANDAADRRALGRPYDDAVGRIPEQVSVQET